MTRIPKDGARALAPKPPLIQDSEHRERPQLHGFTLRRINGGRETIGRENGDAISALGCDETEDPFDIARIARPFVDDALQVAPLAFYAIGGRCALSFVDVEMGIRDGKEALEIRYAAHRTHGMSLEQRQDRRGVSTRPSANIRIHSVSLSTFVRSMGESARCDSHHLLPAGQRETEAFVQPTRSSEQPSDDCTRLPSLLDTGADHSRCESMTPGATSSGYQSDPSGGDPLLSRDELDRTPSRV